MLRRIVHPHVIRYYNCFVHGSSLVLVLELAEGGDLQAVVDSARRRGRACEEDRAWRILWQLLHVRAPLSPVVAAVRPSPLTQQVGGDGGVRGVLRRWPACTASA